MPGAKLRHPYYARPSPSIMPGQTWRDNGHKALCPLSWMFVTNLNVCARLIYALFQIPKFAFSEMWSDLFRAQQGTTEPARGRRQVFGVSASVPHRIGGA